MQKQPNILLITTDQQRYDTIGAAGFPFVKTPYINALAQNGTLFANCYSPNPACIPARHSLLTGLSSKYHTLDHNYFHNEKQVPYDIPSFPRLLSDNHYDTIAIGKMHFCPTRRSNGFNKLFLMEEIPEYREDDEYATYLSNVGYGYIQSIHGVRHQLYMQPQRSLVPEKHHGTAWVANKTIAELEKNKGNRPYMIWTSFIEPHPPFNVPDDWADMYNETPLPEPYDSITPLNPIAEENKAIGEYHSQAALQRAKQLYYSAVSYVDHHIGRIMQKLKELNMYDNTLIIFTSDHGEMFGDNGTFQKFLPYDSSTKVPCIIKPPQGYQIEVNANTFIDLYDMLPTILDVAKIKYPAIYPLAGESLFKPSHIKDRTHQYTEYHSGNKRWVSLRNSKYKYNYFYGGGLEELFDIQTDPKEQTNLLYVDANRWQTVVCEMRSTLIEKEKWLGPAEYIHNNDFITLPPYKSRAFTERNYPRFPKYLGKQEQRSLLSLEEELFSAIKKEPLSQEKPYYKEELYSPKQTIYKE